MTVMMVMTVRTVMTVMAVMTVGCDTKRNRLQDVRVRRRGYVLTHPYNSETTARTMLGCWG